MLTYAFFLICFDHLHFLLCKLRFHILYLFCYQVVVVVVVVVVQSLSCDRLFATPGTAECQASLSFTISWVCSNSCPLSQWYHPIISYSVTPFSSYPQSFPASRSFPMNSLLASHLRALFISRSSHLYGKCTINIFPQFIFSLYFVSTIFCYIENFNI